MSRTTRVRELSAADVGAIAMQIRRCAVNCGDGFEIVRKGHIIFVNCYAEDTAPHNRGVMARRIYIADVWDSYGRRLDELRDALQILVG